MPRFAEPVHPSSFYTGQQHADVFKFMAPQRYQSQAFPTTSLLSHKQLNQVSISYQFYMAWVARESWQAQATNLSYQFYTAWLAKQAQQAPTSSVQAHAKVPLYQPLHIDTSSHYPIDPFKFPGLCNEEHKKQPALIITRPQPGYIEIAPKSDNPKQAVHQPLHVDVSSNYSLHNIKLPNLSKLEHAANATLLIAPAASASPIDLSQEPLDLSQQLAVRAYKASKDKPVINLDFSVLSRLLDHYNYLLGDGSFQSPCTPSSSVKRKRIHKEDQAFPKLKRRKTSAQLQVNGTGEQEFQRDCFSARAF